MTDRIFLPDTDLDALKQESKALLKAVKSADADALQRIKPYFDKEDSPKLTQMQLVIAREFGFESWAKLRSQLTLRDELLAAQHEVARIAKRMNLSKGSKPDVAGARLLHCSFCGKSQHEVRNLIAGPSVFICDECVDLCVKIKEADDEVPA